MFARNCTAVRPYLKYFVLLKCFHIENMANSRYEYVKSYETHDTLQKNCWIVIRVDGKGFSKFCDVHKFTKPNDERGLNLMSLAAITVMQEFNEIILAYGQSDEYSFVFRRDACIYDRRRDKLISCVGSLFTSAYTFNWSYLFMDASSPKYPPTFDARAVLYPTDQNIRDYLSWRQADVHINNLYNTTFWNLVESGISNSEAEKRLRGTLSSDKNEILFQEFNINYNNELAMFRKGTILLRKQINLRSGKCISCIAPYFEDLISNSFWEQHPELLDKTRKGISPRMLT
ncbi:probable tRNA(His) guanylyltransferase isoform X2 [Wyeomyia smithii]|uniref:probable tRNA(His) guanylyltransferase isoform X2 n=1 Tax=Wyeomyia smithii TaxID=174621 RepID=UPI002467F9C0|nr:probable tRNA(His) guanylyltransferase isoform X2 [Wyeomyia smithii]